MTQIAVYQDEGVGLFCSARIMAELLRYFAPHGWSVHSLTASEIRADSGWSLGLRLLVFPGGADQAYLSRLGREGCAHIYRYVAGGGAYLGICGGAYFAAQEIDYRAPDGGRIAGLDRLGLFPGLAKGPPHNLPPGGVEGLTGGCVTEVQIAGSKERRAQLYFQGGPAFHIDETEDEGNITPLAHYAGSGEIAALRVVVGLGVAVLCGPHPEITGPALDEAVMEEGLAGRAEWQQNVQRLTEGDASRRAFFNLLMHQLDIE